jgi:peptidoglycan/LPS O-acetylase OafA/YrhL
VSKGDKNMKYRADIDGLRAVAVLAVVFYHAGLSFPGGHLGVDVFFVISGYLIIKIIYDPMVEGSFSATDFYARRLRRLFPAMFVMLLATSLWALWRLIAPDLKDFGASLMAAFAYVPNIYFYFTNSAYFFAIRPHEAAASHLVAGGGRAVLPARAPAALGAGPPDAASCPCARDRNPDLALLRP